MQLIENWKSGWRLWTVRLWAAVAAMPEVLYQLALALADVLPSLSGVVVANLPPWLRATLAALGVLGVVVRLVRQNIATPAGPA